ncbi:MAG TPA: kelch repeat-containing protein, partial [Polyangiaceae bacterium]|nr:kelch repeat-containing protein [Polyangiaceae bacterium]
MQPGSLCSDDNLQSIATDGSVTDCAPYLCDTSTGKCGASCTLSSDCAGTAFCRDKQCRTGAAAAAPDSGCGCRQAAPKSSHAPWMLLGLSAAMLLRRRRGKMPSRRSAGVSFAALLLLTGCSEASESPPVTDALELAPSSVAAKSLTELVQQFGSAQTASLQTAPRVVFRSEGDRVAAQVDERLRRAELAPAHVTLSPRGNGALQISDENSGMSAEITLDGAADTPLAVTKNLATYLGAAPGGGDIVLRVDASGVEDHVVLHQRGEGLLTYQVGLTQVSGLRLVDSTLELLDAGGAPRLRVSPPYVVDAKGERHPASLSVRGCAVDTSPVAPFDRATTAPGASSCRLIVAWDPALAYPVLVDPAWSTTAGPGVGHKTEHASAVMADGRLLIAGWGSTQAQIYSSGAWAVTGSMASSRTAPTATLLNTGLVLVAGGGTATAERYNPLSGTFSSAGTMSASRSGHRAVALNDNSVLITGGDASGTTQRYVPSTNGWLTPPGNLGSSRAGHAATLLADGRVLVTGGNSSPKSTRLFSLAGGWVAGPNMTIDRQNHVAARLSNDRVLVTGGEDVPNGPGAIADSEQYDPATNSFTAAAPLPAAQRQAVGVPFGNRSKLYVIGGRGNGAGAVSSTWIYSASTNSWVNGSAMQRSRFLHTADLLPTGQILIVGGTSGAETLPPAEIQCVDVGCACTGTGVGSCLVGSCVDGVCCNTSCTGTCQACSAAKKGSGANDVCGPISDGADPDSECAAQAASTCGTIGSCNGAGACRLHPAATECTAASCFSSTIAQPAASCDGSGTCNAPATVSCQSGYACTAGMCNTSCATAAECDVGFVCTGGQCVKKANGEACSAGTECTTGFCVDGVCCDTACTGQCEACNETGTPGLCVQVKGQPKNKPACGGTGVCAGVCSTNTQACAFPSPACGDGMACKNGECLQTAPICVDAGSASQSPAGVKTPCNPYLCNPTTGTCL